MTELTKPVLPGDAFFLLRPMPMEAQTMRIAALPLAESYGGTVPEEFHLTMQRARHVQPGSWQPLLTDLQKSLRHIRPFKLEAVGLWRFYSEFRQSHSLFWTMRPTPALMEVRRSLDAVLEKHGATKYPFALDDWKPHTLALQNVPGQDGDMAFGDGFPRPTFTVNSLTLSIYLPWGSFAEHPVTIFSPSE